MEKNSSESIRFGEFNIKKENFKEYYDNVESFESVYKQICGMIQDPDGKIRAEKLAAIKNDPSGEGLRKLQAFKKRVAQTLRSTDDMLHSMMGQLPLPHMEEK